MSQDPWRVPDHKHDLNISKKSKHSPSKSQRVTRLITFLVGIGLLLIGLAVAFPATGLTMDPYFIRGMLILVIFGGAAAFWSRSSIARLARMAGLWIVIIIGVSVFYIVQSDMGNRFMTAMDPKGVVSNDEGLIVHRSRDGHFWLRAKMNGVSINMMVDTGASNIVLSPDDAKHVGLNPATLNFSERAQTANGDVMFARSRITSLSIGDAEFFDVPVTVNGSPMSGSLMGMSVLSEFKSFEFRGDKLILRR